MIKRAIFFGVMTLMCLILTIVTTGLAMTCWGLVTIACGVQCYIELNDYFDNNHPDMLRFS